jgi:hypothetical protein
MMMMMTMITVQCELLETSMYLSIIVQLETIYTYNLRRHVCLRGKK